MKRQSSILYMGLFTPKVLQINLWWSLAAILLGVATLMLFLWLLGFDVLSSSGGTGYGLAYRWMETILPNIAVEILTSVTGRTTTSSASCTLEFPLLRTVRWPWETPMARLTGATPTLADPSNMFQDIGRHSYKCSVSVHTTSVVQLLRPPRTTWATARSQKGKLCTKIPQLKTPCCQTDRQSCLD